MEEEDKDRVVKDGYLYVREDIVFDVISGKYKLTVKKYWREIYTRRSLSSSFSYGYSNFHIFISKDIPFLTNDDMFNYYQNFEEIKKYWIIILEYAIDKMNLDLVIGFESEKYHGIGGNPLYISQILKIKDDEYLNLNELSPYS